MKINRKWESINLSAWIVSVILLILFFVLAMLSHFKVRLEEDIENIFWGLTGVFASFFSAFFIAWVVDKQSNDSEQARIDRIRSYYLDKPINKVKSFLSLITSPCEDYCGNFKPYFIAGKLNFDNLIWNFNFVFQLKYLVKKKDLVNYKREITVDKGISQVISGSEVVSHVDIILEDLKSIADLFEKLSKDMEEQNIFNKIEIFNKQEISMAKELYQRYVSNNDLTKIMHYELFDDFLKSLNAIVDYYDIEIEECAVGNMLKSLVKSLDKVPNMIKDVEDKIVAIRESAEEYIKSKFI